VLIVGESGTGKSTLMRAVAGIWPWGRGEVRLPREARIMFVPQHVYLPLGTLRAAMAYPLPTDAFPADAYAAVLERAGLGGLAPRIDDEARWDQELSGGEQQRLAIARLLLHRPDWIFLDEATSALDEAGQAELLKLLRAELPEAAVISVGHRPGLDAFHDRTMTLVRGEEGARLVRGARQRRETRRAAAATPTPRQRRTFDRLRAAVERNWRRKPAADA
jgi:putative ATP-binding cassette transporter